MIPANTQIWLVAGITDMRRGYTSLSGLQLSGFRAFYSLEHESDGFNSLASTNVDCSSHVLNTCIMAMRSLSSSCE